MFEMVEINADENAKKKRKCKSNLNDNKAWLKQKWTKKHINHGNSASNLVEVNVGQVD